MKQIINGCPIHLRSLTSERLRELIIETEERRMSVVAELEVLAEEYGRRRDRPLKLVNGEFDE